MKRQFLGTFLLAIMLGCVPVFAQQYPSEPAGSPQQAPGEPSPNGTSYPQGMPSSNQAMPPNLTLPAGTLITVRTTELVSSDQNRPGDSFTTVLDQPLVAQGWVVARRGQVFQGRVAAAQKAGRVQGVSQLAVELSSLSVVDGQQVPIHTQLVQYSGGTTHGRDVQGVGATTGIGAIIGAAAGGGEGAAIGAAAGAVAGIAGVLSTRGRPTEIFPETMLTFRLDAPVTISTEQSQHAFQPVTQQDYENRGNMRNPPRYRTADAYPPPPGYYYPPYYYPPYPGYFGYYYGFGFGPRFYVAPRLYFGRGFHRR